MHLTLTCSRCGGEVRFPFSWDSVKAGHDPATHLLDSLREGYREHLALDLCNINLKRKASDEAPLELPDTDEHGNW